MKRPLFSMIALFLCQVIISQNGVFISELCDPKSNYENDRFIEIYNSSETAVDLSDWTLVAIGNGNDIFTWTLSGSLQPQKALVAGNETTTTTFTVDFPGVGWSSNNGSWNGKVGDGAKLINPAGEIVDYISVEGSAFENKHMVRIETVLEPSKTYNASEWVAKAVDLATDATPGTHTTISSGPQNPSIKNIVINPQAPVEGNVVTVSADITDSESTISSVVLKWGTTETVLDNTIPMDLKSGSTYESANPMPSQSAGTRVYFAIIAQNAEGESKTSSVVSYTIPEILTIKTIQGEVSKSPYDGKEVITSGTVTAVYPGYITMQDANDAWSGIWIKSDETLETGELIKVRGLVTESSKDDFAGTTLLTQISVLNKQPSTETYSPISVSAFDARKEEYEGMLISISEAKCIEVKTKGWIAEDASGNMSVDNLKNLDFVPVLGTVYSVAGVIADFNGNYQVEPANIDDIVWVSDNTAPIITGVTVSDKTKILITFSEEVSSASAGISSNFKINNNTIESSQIVENNPSQVILTISELANGEHQLYVSGVEDMYGNAIDEITYPFSYFTSTAPEGYYDPAEGLEKDALRQALYTIIKAHTAKSYDYAWTAYRTTDVKPNGKVWDIYSDIPGGTPPYEYVFGEDEGGAGGGEGNGYTREHSWPKSWFGGEVMPMYSDLFALYPCDAHVNGSRGNDPYGEVDNADWTSRNGSKKGNNSYPGYSGKVFEPIDEYKGDLARTYFYMCTRYYGEDSAWPGSGMVEGANLKPWALKMMREWHKADGVSQKEISRNNAIYEIQKNRNPFIDHPEWVEFIWGDGSGIGESVHANVYVYSSNRNIYINGEDIQSFKVYSLKGQLMIDSSYNDYIDASGWGSGLYIIKVFTKDGISTHKIILK